MGKKRGGSKRAGKKATAMRPEAPPLAWDRSSTSLGEALAGKGEGQGEGERRRASHDSLAPVSGPAVPEGITPEPAQAVSPPGADERPAQALDQTTVEVAAGAPPEPHEAEPSAIVRAQVAVEAAPRSLVDDEMMRSFFDAAEEKVAQAEREALARETELALSITAEAPPPPHVLARRAQLRKWVSGFLGMAGMLALAVGVKAIPRGSSSTISEPLNQIAASPAAARLEPAAVRLEPAALPPPAARSPEPAAPRPIAEPAAAQPGGEPAPPAAKAPEPSGDKAPEPGPSEPRAEGADQPAAVKAADPELEKALAKKALKLLEAGRNKAAIEASQAAIEADPTDADPYLYWGTALLETGHNAESKKVFRECVQKATRGRRGECVQFGR